MTSSFSDGFEPPQQDGVPKHWPVLPDEAAEQAWRNSVDDYYYSSEGDEGAGRRRRVSLLGSMAASLNTLRGPKHRSPAASPDNMKPRRRSPVRYMRHALHDRQVQIGGSIGAGLLAASLIGAVLGYSLAEEPQFTGSEQAVLASPDYMRRLGLCKSALQAAALWEGDKGRHDMADALWRAAGTADPTAPCKLPPDEYGTITLFMRNGVSYVGTSDILGSVTAQRYHLPVATS